VSAAGTCGPFATADCKEEHFNGNGCALLGILAATVAEEREGGVTTARTIAEESVSVRPSRQEAVPPTPNPR
jgi:hypothetical protein